MIDYIFDVIYLIIPVSYTHLEIQKEPDPNDAAQKKEKPLDEKSTDEKPLDEKERNQE